MKDILIQNTEIASYFLWEYTRHTNAIDMWYCTEDISLFMEIEGILSLDDLMLYTAMPKTCKEYVYIIRNIAFRIHLITKNQDALSNWYVAEKLLTNKEWCQAITRISAHYRAIRIGKGNSIDMIRTEWIKNRLLR